ncbi:protein SapB [Paraliobacillus ryukyuensis]|uniref:Putative Mg2+ transporter-C (MgtC) family protein n=1 Tax=Paraliobacillus ryukyuensis TaxID=200904 RepID=A0A366DVS8_9BACI|nr:MgtC/SapB family protein [Paraliobacillus ryukyuensis]RBO93288.1 putative Mg2+ transporter-C (MgtC) family protein [Paraliobacillus ryukyuensis]
MHNSMDLLESVVDREFIVMSTRILIALVLSGIIGFEREFKQHAAGLRTHILVGVSSCLMMLLSLYGFQPYFDSFENTTRFDPARIPSYVISGIGFLGAGTIIVNGMTIRGLTTAASIWSVAGLGLVIGAGMYKQAMFTVIMIILVLILLHKLERKVANNKSFVYLQIIFDQKTSMNQLFNNLNLSKQSIQTIEINREKDDLIIFVQLESKELNKVELYERVLHLDGVKQIKELDH